MSKNLYRKYYVHLRRRRLSHREATDIATRLCNLSFRRKNLPTVQHMFGDIRKPIYVTLKVMLLVSMNSEDWKNFYAYIAAQFRTKLREANLTDVFEDPTI